jgi:hypothetical protein
MTKEYVSELAAEHAEFAELQNFCDLSELGG